MLLRENNIKAVILIEVKNLYLKFLFRRNDRFRQAELNSASH